MQSGEAIRAGSQQKSAKRAVSTISSAKTSSNLFQYTSIQDFAPRKGQTGSDPDCFCRSKQIEYFAACIQSCNLIITAWFEELKMRICWYTRVLWHCRVSEVCDTQFYPLQPTAQQYHIVPYTPWFKNAIQKFRTVPTHLHSCGCEDRSVPSPCRGREVHRANRIMLREQFRTQTQSSGSCWMPCRREQVSDLKEAMI